MSSARPSSAPREAESLFPAANVRAGMAGLDLVPLAEGIYQVKAATGIGVAVRGKRALLIDTGLDENLVRKVLNHLAKEDVRVEAIVNTHSHADHIGGNAFALQRTGAEAYVPAREAAFVENPALEPLSLYGAEAPDALRTKFLQAAASPVHHVVRGEADLDLAGFRVRCHPVPGHSLDQMAVAVEGICFLGDALLPQATVEKYGVVFATDPAAQRESARRIPDLGYEGYALYHGGLAEDVRAISETNIRAIDATFQEVLEALAAPRTAEDLFRELALAHGWPLTVEQYHLNLATVRGYLAALERAGRIACRVEDARLLWARR